jgi:hypothetical protein
VHLGVEAEKKGLGGEWFWRMPKVLTPSQDAHLKNGEHLSAFEDAHPNEHLSAFEDAEDAH